MTASTCPIEAKEPVMKSATTHVIPSRRTAPSRQPGIPAWLDKLLTRLFSGLRDDAYIH